MLPWRREVVWYLVVALTVLLAVVPSWPAAVALGILTAAAVYGEQVAQETRRREILGEQVLEQVGALRLAQESFKLTLEQHTTRLTTVENRTRPVGSR